MAEGTGLVRQGETTALPHGDDSVHFGRGRSYTRKQRARKGTVHLVASSGED